MPRADAPIGAALAGLERLRAEFGPAAAERKLALLERALSGRPRGAAELSRLHEILCFVQAYPDDERVLLLARLGLTGFVRRHTGALGAHAKRLVNSGIRGTTTEFRFFEATARWLAERWPRHLQVNWKEFENAARLEALLPLLAHPSQSPGMDEYDLGVRGWVDRMRGRDSDAAFLVRRFAQLEMSEAAREVAWDALDVPLRLLPGPDTPNRTLAGLGLAAPHFQREPLPRARPDLAVAMHELPRAVRVLGPREGQRYVDLAREAMVTRERDLDAFAYGDARDVRLVDYGDGLQFAAIGVVPERRLVLEGVYGFLTLKNGVPIGYVLASALYGSSEIAYNVFETWRGMEAAAIYARVLAMTRWLFGSDTFTIYPYQLGGAGNSEGLKSGAWWFYHKLGFRPRGTAVRRLAAQELALMKRRPAHRSGLATLRKLADENVYFQPAGERDDIIGLLPLANVGIAATDFLARHFGADRSLAARGCDEAAAAVLGVRTKSGWSTGERLAWSRWAPIVGLVPGLARWSRAEKQALVAVIRAKGGRRESEFVRRFDAHRRLRAAIARVAHAHDPDAG